MIAELTAIDLGLADATPSFTVAGVGYIDVELSQNGYPIGLATYFDNGNVVAPDGFAAETLDLIANVIETLGWTHGTANGVDWTIL